MDVGTSERIPPVMEETFTVKCVVDTVASLGTFANPARLGFATGHCSLISFAIVTPRALAVDDACGALSAASAYSG